MKKNLFMGLFALMFAASAAFATTKTLTWTDVYFWDDENDPQECLHELMEIDCDHTSGVCRKPTSVGQRQLYEEGCSVSLKQNTGF